MTNDKIIILSDGRKLGYAEYGDLRGKPLFFFHGWPSSRLQAKPLDIIAKKLQIRIISIDRSGYGLSEFKEKRTLLDWPDDVRELADKLKIQKFAVMGVSGGGPYTTVCACKIPERLTKVGIVVGLAPTDITGILRDMKFLNRFVWRWYHTFPFLMQISSSLLWLQARKYIPNYFSPAFRAKADREMLSSGLKKEMETNMQEAFRQGRKAAVMDLKLYTDDWGFRLQDIRAKVFLWYGDADQQVPLAMGEYYASQIPKSKLTIYPNEGHLLGMTHAKEILQALTG